MLSEVYASVMRACVMALEIGKDRSSVDAAFSLVTHDIGEIPKILLDTRLPLVHDASMTTYETVQLSTMSRQVWSKSQADQLRTAAEDQGYKVKVQRREMSGANRYTVVVKLDGRSVADLLTQRKALTTAWQVKP